MDNYTHFMHLLKAHFLAEAAAQSEIVFLGTMYKNSYLVAYLTV